VTIRRTATCYDAYGISVQTPTLVLHRKQAVCTESGAVELHQLREMSRVQHAAPAAGGHAQC
jgi:hypothetical protein